MNEWKRIFSDRRRHLAILCIPILCLFLFFYQKCDGNFPALITDAQEYRELLDTYSDCTPAEIVEAFPDPWSITENEHRLLAQAEHLRSYGAYLDRVQDQAAKMQMTSVFGNDQDSFVYRNIIKIAEDFANCSDKGISPGNDRAVQDWLAFDLADWAFLAAILLLVMAFLEERQKGLSAIIRSCPAGRGKLQFSRLLILLLFSAGMTLVLYYLPLALSLCLDGGWEALFRPVQSMAEFRLCTAQMSIAEFFVQFFFVKTACGFLLGLLIWFLLSFLEQVQLCWMMTAAGLSVEYLLYTLVPAQSVFSPLRYVNVFSYVFTTELYTDYVNINFFEFPVERRTLLLGILVMLAVLVSAATLWVLTKRYPFGNRDWMGKWLHLWNRAGDAVRRHLGLYGFEWYKLLFLSFGGLFLVLGILLTRDIRCNSGAYNRTDDMVYRQYVAQIQGPVTQDTYDYIEDAWQAVESSDLEDTAAFEAALERLEQTVADTEDGAWIVDETTFLNIYGSNAWRLQRKNGLLAMIFLLACLSPLFACEQQGDVKKVLRSTPGGRNKLFWTKYAVALSITALVWLRVFGQEWLAATESLGELVLSAPCGSIGMLKGFDMSVGAFLALLYLSKGLALMIPMHLCVFIGERCDGFEKAFLISGVTLLIPAAAYSFGMDAVQIATPLSFLSDGNLLLSGSNGVISFVAWMGISIVALFAAKQNWSKTT